MTIIFWFYMLSPKHPQEWRHLPLVENPMLAWYPVNLCSCRTHILQDQHISEYENLFLLNLNPLWERVEVIASQFLNIYDVNKHTKPGTWRGIQNYQWLTFVGHASFIPRNKHDSWFFLLTTYFLLPFSIKLPCHNLTIWPFTSLLAHDSWSS